MNFPLEQREIESRVTAFETLVRELEAAVEKFTASVESKVSHQTGAAGCEPSAANGLSATSEDNSAGTGTGTGEEVGTVGSSEKRLSAALAQFETVFRTVEASRHVATGALFSLFVEDQVAVELAAFDGNFSEDFATDFSDPGTDPHQVPTPLQDLKAKSLGTNLGKMEGLPLEFFRDPILARAYFNATYTLSSELACLFECSEPRAHQIIRQSALLMHSPHLAREHQAGHLAWGHMQVILEHSADLPGAKLLEYGRQLAEFIAPPRGTRVKRSRSDVKRRAVRVREQLHVEPLEVRRARNIQDRKVYVSDEQDGMAWLNAYLPAESAHALMNTIDDYARAAKWAEPTPDPSALSGPARWKALKTPRRTLAQLRADALVDLILSPPTNADSDIGPRTSASTTASFTGDAPSETPDSEQPNSGAYPPGGAFHPSGAHPPGGAPNPGAWVRGVPGEPMDRSGDPPTSYREPFGIPESPPVAEHLKPKVFVTVSAETLAGLNDEHATLHDYGPIPAETARQIAAQAPVLYRLLTDPVTGVVLDLERKKYAVTKELREYLHHRSPTCQFPGCSKSARHTDVDHIQDWRSGGATSPENLQLLCRKHHNLKTHHGWTVTANPDGTLTWTSPLGNTYTTEHESTKTSAATAPEEGSASSAWNRPDPDRVPQAS